MRTKTRASRARLSKLPPASTTTTPLPLLSLTEEFNMDKKVLETSRDSGDSSREFIDMDWLEGESCISCDDRGGQVLVCCETGCPIALHDKCMNNEPKFDNMGHFYCPYCWYKRNVKRTKELRKMAMLAKKALSNFIDSKMVGGDKEKQGEGGGKGKEPDISQVVRDINYSDCENRLDDDEVENRYVLVEEDRENDGDSVKPADCDQMDPSSSVVRGDDNVQRGQEETTLGNESLQGSRSEEKLGEEDVSETHEYEVEKDGEKIEAEPLNACRMEEEETEDGSHHVSTKGVCGTVRVSEEKQERTKGEEQKHSIAPETTMLSTGGDTALEVPAEDAVGSELSDSDSEEFIVHQRRIKQRSKKKAQTMLSTRGDTAAEVPAEDAVGSELSDSDSEALSVRQRRIKQKSKKKARIQNVDSPKKSPFQQKSSSQPDATAEGNTRNQNAKVTTPKKSRQPQESAKRFTNATFANEKRKRLHWTAEEEEMLKEGVHKFSTTVNKNLPWRKILEFGRHVFDVTRTPSDLKDKWRNIMAKESSAMNRR